VTDGFTILIIVMEFILKELMYEHLVHKKELEIVEKYSQVLMRTLQSVDNAINKTIAQSS